MIVMSSSISCLLFHDVREVSHATSLSHTQSRKIATYKHEKSWFLGGRQYQDEVANVCGANVCNRFEGGTLATESAFKPQCSAIDGVGKE